MIKSILIYGLTFIISIYFSFLYSKAKDKKMRLVLFILAIALPVFISTFRYGVGTDFFAYRTSYYSIAEKCHDIKSILDYYQEPLHVVINLIAYNVFNNYKGFLFLASLFFMIFSFKGILKYEDKVSVPFAYFIFLLTLFSPSLNGIRQLIAVAIFFNSYKYIYEKNFWKFLLIIIFASLFHKSALLCLPLYFIWIDNGKHNRIFYSLIIAFIFIIPYLSPIIQKLCAYLGIYNKYFEKYEATTTYGFLLYILPILIVLLLVRKKKTSDPIFTFLLRVYILQIPLQIFGNVISFADRLSLYVLPSQIVLFPYFVNTLNKNKLIAKIIVILWYLFYYIIMFIVLKSNEVYPYTFIA